MAGKRNRTSQQNGTDKRNTARSNGRGRRTDSNDKIDDEASRRAMRARNGSPFLTTKEAAFYLGRGQRTLKRWRQKGKGPPYRSAERGILYHIDDIDDWSINDLR